MLKTQIFLFESAKISVFTCPSGWCKGLRPKVLYEVINLRLWLYLPIAWKIGMGINDEVEASCGTSGLQVPALNSRITVGRIIPPGGISDPLSFIMAAVRAMRDW